MTTSILVSVIIPFFNRVSLACRALDSVCNQTYTNIEIILIDDGSTEDIGELQDKVKKNKFATLIRQSNMGPAAARNLGIKHSSGDYIALLDSDDKWAVNKLEVQLRFMLNNQHMFSHTSYKTFNIDNGNINEVKSGYSNYKFPYVAFHCRIATPTVMFHKSLIPSSKLFNENLQVGEDTVAWIELSRKITLYGLPNILTSVQIDENNTANNHRLKMIAFKSINKSLRNNFFIMILHKIYISVRIFFRVL